MKEHSIYENSQFHTSLSHKASVAAHKILPLVNNWLEVKSVVDVGCGTGSWLKAAGSLGAEIILGIDHADVLEDILEIDPRYYRNQDLTQPFGIDQRFDLAISLEVAEHLPGNCAAGFVQELTRLSDFVLFSAAIPGQGGHGHLNEQWPEYWAGLFAMHNFLPVDCIRQLVWHDKDVAVYYRQNILLFAAKESLESIPALQALADNNKQLALVHPLTYRAALGR